jgi:hypothetical protein
MAGIALRAGYDMARAFSGGNHTVMATGTHTQRFIVIDG